MINADLSPSAFLAYCQANEVQPYTLHVRDPGEDGLQLDGGPIGSTLCGKWIANGWDTAQPVTTDTLAQSMPGTTVCPGCRLAAHASLLAGFVTRERHQLAARISAMRTRQQLYAQAEQAVAEASTGDLVRSFVNLMAEIDGLRYDRDRLADEQARATDVESAADLVAELVRRADAATAAHATAEAGAATANKYAREQAVNAERYRQLRSFVRRWLNHGDIPAEHEADVRALCQLEIS